MGREFLVGGRNVYTYALFGLIWCLICYVGFKFSANCKIPAFIAYIILGVGLLVRIVYSVKVFGYTGDIISFSDWGARAVEYGFSGFYVKDFLTDYPPGYVYVLYAIGRIRAHFHIAQYSVMDLFLLKFPSICCDVMCSYLIYRESRKRMHFSELQSVFLMSAYLFQPTVILDSACWGQVDAIYTLVVVILCLLLMDGRMLPAYGIYGIGILLKPQTIMFTPVLLVGIINHVFLKDFSWKKFFRNLVGGFSVIGGMALVAAPFGLGKVISQYTDTLGSYPYTSINAYNFWTLVGLGGRDQNTVFLFLPCSVWSNIVIVLVVLFTILILIRCRDKIYCYFLGSSFIILTMFTFAVNMHERYMFPALALVLFVFIYQPTKPVWLCYSAFSVATFCNIAWQLFNLWNRAPGNAQLLAVRISAVIVEAVVFLWDSDSPVCGDGR